MNRCYLEKVPHSIIFSKTVEGLYGKHRSNFDGIKAGAGTTRHTSLDWFLAPKERPSIEKASVKERYVDIPGINGGLDLTESLTGFPLFNYIEGSFEFTILNDKTLLIVNDNCKLMNEKTISWEMLNKDIRAFLNGKTCYMMLEDDPSWYYEGRFSVERYDSSESSHSKITIGYKVYPYKKLSVCRTTDSFDTYFDTIPLTTEDTTSFLVSFFDKKQVKVKPGKSVSFSKAGIPCGEEAVPIKFTVNKNGSDAYKLQADLKTYDGLTLVREIVDNIVTSKDKVETVKLHGFVLTNSSTNTVTSDNVLTLSASYPNDFNSLLNYKKDDYVSYISTQDNIKWILVANEDIIAGSIDLTKWSVDINAMNISAFSSSNSYKTGDKVYILDNNTLTLYKAIIDIPAGEFDSDDWSTSINVDNDDVYDGIIVDVNYDIGVM